MKVFLSSVFTGLESFREAASTACVNLGCDVIRAEDFGASPTSPQRACLYAVRAADVVVLLLGQRYGPRQQSGLSATHEEYRAARDTDKVIPYIQQGVVAEEAQQAFIDEVRQWEGGQFAGGFSSPTDLSETVTRDLHRLEVSRAGGAVDEDELVARALSVFVSRTTPGDALDLCIAAGPQSSVIRPSELSSPELAQLISEITVTGPTRLFPIEGSGGIQLVDDCLTFSHRQGSVSINELGTVMITQPARRARGAGQYGMDPLIQEDIAARIAGGLRFAAVLLDRVDQAGRLTTVVPVVRLTSGYTAWMSRAEADAMRGGAMTLNVRGGPSPPVHLTPRSRRRSTLTADVDNMAQDLAELLRRAVLSGRLI